MIFVARRPALRHALLANAIAFMLGSAVVTAAIACAALIALGDERRQASAPPSYGPGGGRCRLRARRCGLRVPTRLQPAPAGGADHGHRLVDLSASAPRPLEHGRPDGDPCGACVGRSGRHSRAGLPHSRYRWKARAGSTSVCSRRPCGSAVARIGSLSRFLNFRVDQILMGFLASEAALGIYAVAVNASEVLLYLPR